MLSDRIRRRLEALNRSPSTAPLHSRADSDTSATDANLAQSTRLAAPLVPSTTSSARNLHDSNGSEVVTAWGPHWRIAQPLKAVWPHCDRYLAPRLPFLRPEQLSDPELRALAGSFPQRVVLLDLETCGLAGSVVFLIGMLYWEAERLVLSQLWARSYAEEKAILQTMWATFQDRDVLVTFNGKSFDWPQVHDRSTRHHLGQRHGNPFGARIPLRFPSDPRADGTCALQPDDVRPEPQHVDLLHHARRRWKAQLPNCRLQTLERYICGRHRVGDLPGKEIPQAYHDYVRTGQTHDVAAILHHNALDLVTLLQLALVFLQD